MLTNINTINNAVWTAARIVNHKYINWVRIDADSNEIDNGIVIFKVLTPIVDTDKHGINEVENYIKKLGVSEITKKSTRFPMWVEKYGNWFYETKIKVTFY